MCISESYTILKEFTVRFGTFKFTFLTFRINAKFNEDQIKEAMLRITVTRVE